MKQARHTGAHGFTLIEVMIVVVVVAILAAVALPSYQESVRKSRRAEARAQLLEVAQYMERFYSQNDRYDQVNDGSATPASVSIPAALTTVPRSGSGGSVYYNIGFQSSTLDARGFTLEAVPTGAQASDRCGTLRLSSVGRRTVDNGTWDAARCWR